jgi:hypothetical protein
MFYNCVWYLYSYVVFLYKDAQMNPLTFISRSKEYHSTTGSRLFHIQLQDPGCFTLNYRIQAVSHSTTGSRLFHTQLQDPGCFTLNYRIQAVSNSTTGSRLFHSITGSRLFHTQLQDPGCFTLISGFESCSVLKTQQWL